MSREIRECFWGKKLCKMKVYEFLWTILAKECVCAFFSLSHFEFTQQHHQNVHNHKTHIIIIFFSDKKTRRKWIRKNSCSVGSSLEFSFCLLSSRFPPTSFSSFTHFAVMSPSLHSASNTFVILYLFSVVSATSSTTQRGCSWRFVKII